MLTEEIAAVLSAFLTLLAISANWQALDDSTCELHAHCFVLCGQLLSAFIHCLAI